MPVRTAPPASRCCPDTHPPRLLPPGGLAVLAILTCLSGLAALPAAEQSPGQRRPSGLDAARLPQLQERLGEYRDELPDPATLGLDQIVAYEEHPLFVYVRGTATLERPVAGTLVHRRVLFLKPATFLVDNLIQAPAAEAGGRPKPIGDQVRGAEGGSETVSGGRRIVGQTLRTTAAEPGAADAPVRRRTRLFEVLTGDAGESRVQATVEGAQILVKTPERQFRLSLPASIGDPGMIEVLAPDGRTLLASRPLPAGILPHGPSGVAMLERWDSAYRGSGRPGWDVGRPASDLKQAVEQGALRPGRIVELGCGSGTNAIYLAGQGFDVTAIDVAPTALAQAQNKAEQAGVQVRWLLADVTAPPELAPFDAVFDRGCYHGVRRGNAAGYVQALRQLTRPGSKVLILAGNANEQRGGGPPRVTEQEIRGDFSEHFDFVWLKETRFDSPDTDRSGALAWSILLERKSGE